jgi:hypothetical protein
VQHRHEERFEHAPPHTLRNVADSPIIFEWLEVRVEQRFSGKL